MRYVKFFHIISLFLFLKSSSAEACSCEQKSEWIKKPEITSFDGRVIDVHPLKDDTSGIFVSRIQVVRRIKGELDSEVQVFTRASDVNCGAAKELTKAHLLNRLREFHIFRMLPGIYTDLPTGEMYLGMCGVYTSELDPDPPRARR